MSTDLGSDVSGTTAGPGSNVAVGSTPSSFSVAGSTSMGHRWSNSESFKGDKFGIWASNKERMALVSGEQSWGTEADSLMAVASGTASGVFRTTFRGGSNITGIDNKGLVTVSGSNPYRDMGAGLLLRDTDREGLRKGVSSGWVPVERVGGQASFSGMSVCSFGLGLE